MGMFSSKWDQNNLNLVDFYSEISKLPKFVIVPRLVKIDIFNKKQKNKH